jgi:hypothetical protein
MIQTDYDGEFEGYLEKKNFPAAIRYDKNGEIAAISIIDTNIVTNTAILHLYRHYYFYVDSGVFKAILGKPPSGVWVLSMITTVEFDTLKEFGILDITEQVSKFCQS